MLRIIGGDLKRRLIHTPPDATITRPMPDRVRQSIFNLLRGHTEGVEVFDAFAGTGCMGFEALSRGATGVVFVERERSITKLIERSAEELGVADRIEIASADALGGAALARCPEGVHLIFFDPPYPLVRDPAQWPRVREQLGRLIGKLDDTGYALLRTPWPFLHAEEGEAEEGRPAPRRFRDEEVEEIDLDEASPKAPMHPVDLAIPGALGPETHGYGSMAVHLYMRDPGAPGTG
ncbi:MAG: RsmD family RNA methyltransferase [Phycisphaerales bacterium]|nr:RsmD family RNA methyltransferase [Phycisphaerales bacterium]